MNDEDRGHAAALPQALPLDDHNRRWLAHTHPAGWTNPTPQGRYNLVVVGAGTAGLVTAAGAAGLGARVALIERDLLGGDCLNVGCVPSKALIRSARAAADVRDAARFGVRVPPGVEVDFPAVMARMRRLRAGISPHDSAARFRDLGIDVFLGSARFTSPHTVEVGGQTLRYTRACIATGARASAPSIPGLSDVAYLTNETVFSLTALPRRLAVIGAGPIGCELAQAFARFGSEVFLVEAQHGVLPAEDPGAAALVKQALERDGVRVLCCGQNLQIRGTAGGPQLSVDSHAGHYDVTVDQILVGTGRTPNVDGLGLEAAGVAFDRHGVTVNDFLQTSQTHIYAAGDVCSRFKFTHAADAMARIVIQNALFFGRKRTSALIMPWCTYTDPEVAHVGLYPKDAEAQGLAIDTYTIEHAKGDRAMLDGESEGFLKVHTRKGKDAIVGATIVARHAGDLISEIGVAMTAGAGLASLAATIHPYPTQAEIIKKAGDAYSRTRLTPRVKRLFEQILRWRR
ncbi:MAG: mercuric reductase [Vicinamibacterales bacterium]|nr:mercuric reductase [Vicinamibacterales bacterium]